MGADAPDMKDKKHKKDKKQKEDKKAKRKSHAIGPLEVTSNGVKPVLTQSNRGGRDLNLTASEAEILLSQLDNLPPPSPRTVISTPAITHVLCDCVDEDNIEEGEALVALGADVNALHPTRGITALTVAAEQGNLRAIRCDRVISLEYF